MARSAPFNSQAQGSQARRQKKGEAVRGHVGANGRRRGNEDSDEDEDEDEDMEDGAEAGRGGGNCGKELERDVSLVIAMKEDWVRLMGGRGPQELNRLTASLVRLALFTEYKRHALRRDDINKKVLAGRTRAFNQVLASAQKHLSRTFGMELIELRTKGSAGGAKKGARKRKAAEGGEEEEEGKKGGGGSRSYILRSVIDPDVQARAAELEIIESDDDAEDDDADLSRSRKGLINWAKGDGRELLGILHTVLGLILVSGRVLSDDALFSYLKKLSLLPSTPLLIPGAIPHRPTLESQLSTLVRCGYLEKHKSTNPASTAQFEYRWGPRAEREIGEGQVAGFVADVYLAREEMSGRAKKEREAKIMNDIGRAAGGDFVEA